MKDAHSLPMTICSLMQLPVARDGSASTFVVAKPSSPQLSVLEHWFEI